jgi:hypothetical protein
LQNSQAGLQNRRKKRCNIRAFVGEWCNGSTTGFRLSRWFCCSCFVIATTLVRLYPGASGPIAKPPRPPQAPIQRPPPVAGTPPAGRLQPLSGRPLVTTRAQKKGIIPLTPSRADPVTFRDWTPRSNGPIKDHRKGNDARQKWRRR